MTDYAAMAKRLRAMSHAYSISTDEGFFFLSEVATALEALAQETRDTLAPFIVTTDDLDEDDTRVLEFFVSDLRALAALHARLSQAQGTEDSSHG